MSPLLWWKNNKYYILCVSVALVIWHIKRMRSIILLFVACVAAQCLSKLAHKRRGFRKNIY